MKKETLEMRIRKYIAIATFFCILLVLLGSGLNSLGHKYAVSHSIPTNTNLNSWCEREVYTLNEPDSKFCCEGLRRQDWVCIAGFDRINKIMTGLPWAYVLPLLPWVCSTLFFPSEISFKNHLKRLFLYVGIILFRVFILYVTFAKIQTFLNNQFNSNMNMNINECWYSHLRKNNDCNNERFDFSDHIVFYMTVYVIPSTIEASWTLYIVKKLYNDLNGTVTVLVPWYRYVPTLIICVLIYAISARNMMFTMLYFHTPLENVVALLLFIMTIVTPIWLNMHSLSESLLTDKVEDSNYKK